MRPLADIIQSSYDYSRNCLIYRFSSIIKYLRGLGDSSQWVQSPYDHSHTTHRPLIRKGCYSHRIIKYLRGLGDSSHWVQSPYDHSKTTHRPLVRKGCYSHRIIRYLRGLGDSSQQTHSGRRPQRLCRVAVVLRLIPVHSDTDIAHCDREGHHCWVPADLNPEIISYVGAVSLAKINSQLCTVLKTNNIFKKRRTEKEIFSEEKID